MLTCTQARQALTGALKIWWDQSQKNKHNNEPDWQPALLPSVFAGAKAAAMTRNVDPNQVLAACHVCRCFACVEPRLLPAGSCDWLVLYRAESHTAQTILMQKPKPNWAMPWEDTASLLCLHLFHLQHVKDQIVCLVKVSVPDFIRVLQAPGKMYTRICMISDILPSEWPPVQVRKGVPHPPPTHREYRVALANGLIPLKQDFRDMVTTAVASDSRMFRAALVRLMARASGLQAPTQDCMCHLMLAI
jgi:hypothetical protein